MAFPQILRSPSSFQMCSLDHPRNTTTPSSSNPDPKFLSHRTSLAILRRQKPKFPKYSASSFSKDHTNSLKLDDLTYTPIHPKFLSRPAILHRQKPKFPKCSASSFFEKDHTNPHKLDDVTYSPVHRQSTADIFHAWCKKYGKAYSSDEEKKYRLGVFEENLAFVTQHNMSNSTFEVSLYAFSDLTEEEFVATYGCNFEEVEIDGDRPVL